MGRLIVLLAWAVLISPSAVAQIPCPGAIILGCASPYYNEITVASLGINLGAFTAPVGYPPAISASPLGVVLGSVGTPDTTATPAGYFEKIGTGLSSLGVNAALTGAAIMTGSDWGDHVTGILGQAESRGAQPSGSGTEPYLEALRGNAISNGTIAVNAAGAILSAGTNGASPYEHLSGSELIVQNNYDSPTFTFNPLHSVIGAVLDCGYAGTSPHNCDAAVYLNIYSVWSGGGQFWRGFFADTNTINAGGVLIEGRGHMLYGLNLQFATSMNAWAVIPNNAPLWQINSTGSALNILNLSGANTLTVGQDTGLANVAIASAAVPTNILGNATVAGTLIVTSRTGTAAAFACFASDGSIVSKATACQP